MKAIRRFIVRSVLPPELSALGELAGNLRWAWHEPIRRLFERVDPELWRRGGADPTALLGAVSPERLAELARDQGFVDEAWRLRDELERYRTEPRWYQSLAEGYRVQSPTSRRNSASPRRFRSTPVGSASSRATTSKPPPTWVCR